MSWMNWKFTRNDLNRETVEVVENQAKDKTRYFKHAFRNLIRLWRPDIQHIMSDPLQAAYDAADEVSNLVNKFQGDLIA